MLALEKHLEPGEGIDHAASRHRRAMRLAGDAPSRGTDAVDGNGVGGQGAHPPPARKRNAMSRENVGTPSMIASRLVIRAISRMRGVAASVMAGGDHTPVRPQLLGATGKASDVYDI